MRFLDSEQREGIGFSYIIERINTICKLGDDKKRALAPYTKNNFEQLEMELSNVEKMIALFQQKEELIANISYILCKVKDIQPSLRKLGTGMVLDEIELFEIKLFSKVCMDIKAFYEQLHCELSFIELEDVGEVFKLLDPEETGYETFYIYDNFSNDLKQLREVRRKLEQQIQSANSSDEKNDLLHQRAEILAKEEKIEFEIKQDLSTKLIAFQKPLLTNSDSIGYLDFLMAKAKYAMSSKASKPKMFSDARPIALKKMYNPYYEELLSQKGATMQRLDLSLKSGVTVLTGANMGGKSIAMKSVALNVLLANSGLYVYAEDAEIPVIDFLYMIADDLQSVDKGLSSFGAEMIELKTIVGASAVKDGLILLDELSRGTNPDEGRIIVNAMIRLFNERKSYTFISTHFDGVRLDNVTHLQVVGISRVNFEQLKDLAKKNSKEALSILQRHMDYSVEEIGHADVPKNALQIANLLGLELDFERA